MKEQDWKKFEYHMVDFHNKLTNQITYHWDFIPEEVLYDAGYIYTYKSHRLNRLELKQMKLDKINPIPEYGLDGLAYDSENKVYHGLQMKYWKSNSYLNAYDLGSFHSVILNRLMSKNQNSKGYLYYTCRLAGSLKEEYEVSKNIIHKQIDHIKFTEEKEVNQYEVNLELYDYQKEAVKSLDASYINHLNPKPIQTNITENSTEDSDSESEESNEDELDEPSPLKLLNMTCGCGKTVILGNHLKNMKPNFIIAIAELKATIDQLKTRITPFIPEYESLLIDSDNNGTTNIEFIIERIVKAQDENKKIIVYSTFKSCENIIAILHIFDDNKKYIIVDEAHNLLSNKTLCEYVNSFPFGVLMTATPQSQLEDALDYDIVYEYGIRKAIDEKRIVDYKVYLPYLDDPSEPMKEFEDLDQSLVDKGLFLVNGLLNTGSRKCITYMRSIDECKQFEKLLMKIVEDYHGLELWTDHITADTSKSKRDKVLKDFQKEDKLCILNSIRILDEAIDIPKCDSEFISFIGENTSDIRTVQRLMRGCRIDKENSNKVNNLFLWSDDIQVSKSVLTLLKENDVQFHQKIRYIGKEYDKNDNKEVVKKIQEKNEITKEYIKINCVELSEWWFMRLTETKQYLDTNEKRPSKKLSKKTKETDEKKSNENKVKKLGEWVCVQMKLYNRRQGMFARLDIRTIWETEIIYNPKYYQYFLNNESDWINNLNKVILYIDTNNEKPNKRYRIKDNLKDLDEATIKRIKEIRYLGSWIIIQTKHYKKGKYIVSTNNNVKLKWESFINDPKYKTFFTSDRETWLNNFELTKKYLDSGIKPTKDNPIEDISDIGKWINIQMGNYKKKIRSMKDEEIFNKWHNLINNPLYKKHFKSNENKWQTNFDKLKEFYDKLPQNEKRKPLKSKSDENDIANWLCGQKQNFKNNEKTMKPTKDNKNRKIWIDFMKNPNYSKLFD